MLTMTDKNIQEIISKLDQQIPKEDAEVIFAAYGETAAYANKQGYLRLGIEFLKMAYSDSDGVGVLDYMMADQSDFTFDHLTKHKDTLEFLSS